MNRARLHELYETQVKPKLMQELGLKNPWACPRLVKVVINVGVSEDQHQDQALANMAKQLAIIGGQQPMTARAKKSIAEFKIRAGDPIGLKVTLRGRRMHQFVDKLINLVLPQIKDFQGVNEPHFL